MAVASYRDDHDARPLEEANVSDVTPCRLVIRCLIENHGSLWQAFTLEFGLAVQGESESDVRAKLERMIEHYIRDALVGDDRDHAYELLVQRKATWQVYAKYYWVFACTQIESLIGRSKHHHDGMIYRKPIPLQPCEA